MRRDERVAVQGPVKTHQRDGMSHGGGGGTPACPTVGLGLGGWRDARAVRGTPSQGHAPCPYLFSGGRRSAPLSGPAPARPKRALREAPRASERVHPSKPQPPAVPNAPPPPLFPVKRHRAVPAPWLGTPPPSPFRSHAQMQHVSKQPNGGTTPTQYHNHAVKVEATVVGTVASTDRHGCVGPAATAQQPPLTPTTSSGQPHTSSRHVSASLSLASCLRAAGSHSPRARDALEWGQGTPPPARRPAYAQPLSP